MFQPLYDRRGHGLPGLKWRECVLADWARGDVMELPDKCFHELIEEQCDATPDATAVLFGSVALSYRELDRRANRLAHRLRGRGTRPGTLVALCLDRSPELIVSILAVLKAGGAYVPVDPVYPVERIRWMIDDCSAAVVVTQTRLRERVAGGAAAVLCPDGDRTATEREPSTRPSSLARPADLAYAIYTSGSTGQPKGVMITHRSVVNLALAQRSLLRLNGRQRVLQFSSASFDASVWDIAMSIASGASLVLVPEAVVRDPDRLAREIVAAGVTVATIPPSVVQQLPPIPAPFLVTLINAGEACWPELVGDWGPGRRYLNAFGPTETTCASLLATLEPGRPVTIGRPIANSHAYVLDAGLRRLPASAIGELCIGGAGLARGYLDRPAQTAERFVPDPYASEPGSRMYRTGDLARLLPGAEFQYLGRADHQVKVRGFRIELAEIESALAAHPDVRQTVVTAVERGPGDVRLVAYVVARDGAEARGGELSSFLATRLPDHMVPSAYVFLQRLPLTVSGKIDRGALPEPGRDRPSLDVPFRGPSDATEEVVVAVVAGALGLERVGVDDSLFALGANSLLVAKITHALRQRFGVDVVMHEIFRQPTPANLSAQIDAGRRERATGQLGFGGTADERAQ